MNTLLIDAGNSRVKWGWGVDQQLEAVSALENGQLQQLPAAWGRQRRAQRVCLCNSAGQESERQIVDAVELHWGLPVEVARPARHWAGLVNGYQRAQQLGIDRWLGMVAAWHRLQSAFCLIDCGTAVTGALLDPGGAHLGGIILPGIGSTMEQLLQRAPHLRQHLTPLHQQSTTEPAGLLGRETAMALRAAPDGVERTLEAVLAQLSQAYGAYTLILTGGGAAVLQQTLVGPAVFAGDLVLEGLLRQSVDIG